MRSNRILVCAATTAFAALYFATLPDPSKGSGNAAQASQSVTLKADPMIEAILALTPDLKDRKLFLDLLDLIATKHGWRDELSRYSISSPWLIETRAVVIESESKPYIVALVRIGSSTRPGMDSQLAILLDPQGNRLDDVACEISYRIAGEPGNFRAEAPAAPDSDGAQIVVRLGGLESLDNYDLTVNHAGEYSRYPLGPPLAPISQLQIRNLKWHVKGLCRIAIKKGKFDILFPTTQEK